MGRAVGGPTAEERRHHEDDQSRQARDGLHVSRVRDRTCYLLGELDEDHTAGRCKCGYEYHHEQAPQ